MKEEKTISVLQNFGWNVVITPGRQLVLPPDVEKRYPNIPSDIRAFLGEIQSCVNPTETAWFMTQSDFDGSSGSAFRWNEFERISLDAAESDQKLESDIRAFWDSHFPFMLSVKSGYAFFAVCLKAEKIGSVVHGYEPEFEEASEIAPSFKAFLEIICEAIQSPGKNGLISAAI